MAVQVSEQRVPAPNGTLYTKTWTPADAQSPTLLLFHDSLGCVALWRDFPAQLAAATQARVVAYDRWGFGQSDARQGTLPVTFTRDEAVAAVPALCDALAIRRLIPVGHSVGGAMAIATAARWPDLCPAAVTISAQSFVEDVTLRGIEAAQADFALPGQLERLAKYHGAKARWALDAWTGTWRSPAFATWNLDHDLAALQSPLLAIHGDRDEYGTLHHPERIAQHAGAACQTVILEACGHFPHREQSARVIEEIAGFVGRHTAGFSESSASDRRT